MWSPDSRYISDEKWDTYLNYFFRVPHLFASGQRKGVAPVIPLSNHLPLQLTAMTEDTLTPPRPRVLSGMRPTGRLHLGNYMGALYNWVQLQHQYDCYFFIADLHALTTDYADPDSAAPEHSRCGARLPVCRSRS